MISTALAAELREAGLRWEPISGDAFQIDLEDFEGDQFHVADMTIEPHHYSTGTILGFNGTTEWALDSVSLEDALWLPREDQLRELLRGAFVSLGREPHEHETLYRVVVRILDEEREFAGSDAAEAYGNALLALIRASGA